MKIRDIYKFDIIDEINAGNIVYMVDKIAFKIASVNSLSVEEYAKIMSIDNKNEIFEFYVIEKE